MTATAISPRFPRPDPTRDRRCEVCYRAVTALGSLCESCRLKRRTFGHPKLSKFLPRYAWEPILPLVRDYMTEHPPSAEVLAAMQRVIGPGNPPPPTMSRLNPRYLLHTEVRWWQDPRARKKHNQRGRLRARSLDYTPLAILANLTAVSVYIEEREGHGFPGNVADVTMGVALASTWKRPQFINRNGRKEGRELRATVRLALGRRIRESAVGVWLIVASRAIIRLRVQQEAAKAKLPRKPEMPPVTIVSPIAKPTREQLLIARYVDRIEK